AAPRRADGGGLLPRASRGGRDPGRRAPRRHEEGRVREPDHLPLPGAVPALPVRGADPLDAGVAGAALATFPAGGHMRLAPVVLLLATALWGLPARAMGPFHENPPEVVEGMAALAAGKPQE